MTPKVSVVMSVYNGEAFVAEAIESILAQTERAWEFLIVDDASTDGTPAVLARFAKADARVQMIRNGENIGLTRSLNRALKDARAPFVARQDADDVSAPARFQAQVEFLEGHPGCGAVGSAYRVIDVDGSPLSVTVPPLTSEEISRALQRRNVLAHGSLMFRTEALREVNGYREEFRSAQDYDLLLRLQTNWTIRALPDPLYALRLVPTSISMAGVDEQSRMAHAARTGVVREAGPRSVRGDARYHHLKALHLLKSGRNGEARRSLFRAGLRSRSNAGLFFLSFLPAFVRRLLIAARRRADTRA